MYMYDSEADSQPDNTLSPSHKICGQMHTYDTCKIDKLSPGIHVHVYSGYCFYKCDSELIDLMLKVMYQADV